MKFLHANSVDPDLHWLPRPHWHKWVDVSHQFSGRLLVVIPGVIRYVGTIFLFLLLCSSVLPIGGALWRVTENLNGFLYTLLDINFWNNKQFASHDNNKWCSELLINLKANNTELPHDKTNKMTVHPAKTQISLACGHRRPWSDWADAQADLSLRWAHNHIVGFVMRWLIFYWEIWIIL